MFVIKTSITTKWLIDKTLIHPNSLNIYHVTSFLIYCIGIVETYLRETTRQQLEWILRSRNIAFWEYHSACRCKIVNSCTYSTFTCIYYIFTKVIVVYTVITYLYDTFIRHHGIYRHVFIYT